MIEVTPVTGIGEVRPGDDVAALLLSGLAESGGRLENSDIVIVTQKILSKAEDRFVELSSIAPGEEAAAIANKTGKDARLVEIVLRESARVVRAAPGVLITRHRLGFVMANAGVDRSNIGPGAGDRVLLLPENPDASAEKIAITIEQAMGVKVGVVVSDSFGRPWRNGVVGIAIGAYGLPSLDDRRGDLDRDGRTLEVTQIAIADLIASAASLVAGEGDESVPAVIIRGLKFRAGNTNAAALIRGEAEDLFL